MVHIDQLAQPSISVGRRACSSFHVCGAAGLTCAIATGIALTGSLGLSFLVLAAVAVAAVATFLVLALGTKLLLGEERLIYYHHEVAILAAVTVLLWVLGQPVLAYLDVTILGVGAFLFCGRVGCFMVGCCHGRPHHWGVRYGPEHADAGFTPYLVGVRLFPIQLVEAVWVFVAVLVGIALVLRGGAPGEALAWYVIVYDLGRFTFEFMRGDPARPYRAGFSEGQWTSLLLMLVIATAELGGLMPLHGWHIAATAGVGLTMMALTWYRRGRNGHRLLSARHTQELAVAVELISGLGDGVAAVIPDRLIPVATTSVGIRISAGYIDEPIGRTRHYTMSREGAALSAGDAHALGDLLIRLERRSGPVELHAGRHGAFHYLVRPTRGVPLHQPGSTA
jgi:hypothetical protein